MKRRGERWRGRGEGWLVAAALLFVLALFYAVYMARIEPAVTVAPVDCVDYERLRKLEMVNINEACTEELSRLPGIGEVLAERIVAYRDVHGAFESAQQLLNVEGIGEGKLEAIRSEIYVD